MTLNKKIMQDVYNNLSIQANGIVINYDDSGIGEIPIVFIHGFPFDKSMWEPQLNYFKLNFRVISYDIRGYGKTTSDERDPDMNLFADDLIAFLDALHIDKAIVCGLSMGGYILLNALDRYPEKIFAVILSDTQCIGDSAETKEKRTKSIASIEERGLTEFASAFVKNVFFKDSYEENLKIIDKIKSVILSTSSQTVTGTLKALAERKDMCFSLREILVPALILVGEEDTITPLTESQRMKDNIPGSKLFIIPKAGHMSNLDQPELFNEYLNNFLSEILI